MDEEDFVEVACDWLNNNGSTDCESPLDANMSSSDEDVNESQIAVIYRAWVPVILFFCALTFLFNIFIVIAARWMRRPLTPTMFFSLSLAAADAIASLNVGIGLILNSLLPKVYKLDIPRKSPCTMLALEAVRLGAVIVTVVHLLALAINHYIGIARPLHYAAIMTKRTATVCIVLMWIGPNAALFAYFSSVENQGFQSPECTTEFLRRLSFRGQYASFFFAPLFIMIFIYGHIFVIIRRHQASRRALTQHSTISLASRASAPDDCNSTATTNYASSSGSRRFRSSTTGSSTKSTNSLRVPSLRRGRTVCSVSSTAEDHSSPNAVSRNIKAIVTTLLIVGTFIIGWMPAVVWFIVFCEDCVVPFSRSPPLNVTLGIGITVNSLIVLKSFLDPIIYTARMKDFKVAFHRMRYQLLSKCCPRYRRGTPAQQAQGAAIDLDEGTLVHFNNRSVAHHNGSNRLPQTRHSTSFRASQQPQMHQSKVTVDNTELTAARHLEQMTSLVTVKEDEVSGELLE